MNEENNLPQDGNSPKISSDEIEMTEEDLEQVAGGFTPIPIPEGKFDKIKGSLIQDKINLNSLHITIKGGTQH